MSPVKKSALWILLAFLSLAAGYLGYSSYLGYLDYKAAQAEEAARQQIYALNRTTLIEALSREGVGADELVRGFWYSYRDASGGESVGRFDLDTLAWNELLAAEYVAMLASRVGDAYRVPPTSMRYLENEELPEKLQFHNALYNPRQPGAFQGTQQQLESAYASGDATSEELWQLAYTYELRGEYEKRDELNKANCRLFKERCGGDVRIRAFGRVVDTDGRPVQAATVEVLSADGASVDTNEEGEFELTLTVDEMEKVRIEASKRNFSSGVASIVVVSAGKSAYDVGDIVLGSPVTIITLDTARRTVSDPASEARPDGSFVLRADVSEYIIPPGAIVRADGTPYRGAVDAYIYEFDRDTVPANLVTLDIFDEVYGYTGDLMLTFGMPFIQFFTLDGERLDVLSRTPMLLTYKFPHFDKMLTNEDGILNAGVTTAEVDTLIAASRGKTDFPITSGFLFANAIHSFPPFWVMDRKSGVWDNVGIRMLDNEGTIQAPFYTAK